MSPKNEETEEEPSLDELTLPEFKSKLPGYLADAVVARDRHMLETLDIVAQKIDFVLVVLSHHNKVLRKVEKRTNRYEKLKLMLTSKWGIIAYIVMLVLPLIMTKLVQKYWP